MGGLITTISLTVSRGDTKVKQQNLEVILINQNATYVCVCVCVYIYIYIYI